MKSSFDVKYFLDGSILVVATRSGLLRQYSTDDFQLERTWKSLHNGPVRVLAFDPTSTFLASGGSDGTVKVWDVIRKFCTHNLKVIFPRIFHLTRTVGTRRTDSNDSIPSEKARSIHFLQQS